MLKLSEMPRLSKVTVSEMPKLLEMNKLSEMPRLSKVNNLSEMPRLSKVTKCLKCLNYLK
jgi:hypothetical protein